MELALQQQNVLIKVAKPKEIVLPGLFVRKISKYIFSKNTFIDLECVVCLWSKMAAPQLIKTALIFKIQVSPHHTLPLRLFPIQFQNALPVRYNFFHNVLKIT